MRTKEVEQQFKTIVNSLLSTQPIDPSIIQAYVRQYAKNAGVPYDLAKRAVILQAKNELIKKINAL